MRKTLCLLAVLGFALPLAVPAFAAPPQIPCTLQACCRQPCGTWCVDWQGNYQDCQTYVGACDGACDLSQHEIGEAVNEPVLDEVPPFELFPLQQDEVPTPLHTPVPAAGCPAAA